MLGLVVPGATRPRRSGDRLQPRLETGGKRCSSHSTAGSWRSCSRASCSGRRPSGSPSDVRSATTRTPCVSRSASSRRRFSPSSALFSRSASQWRSAGTTHGAPRSSSDANTIGTAYLRAQTLSEPIRSRSLPLYVKYTDASLRLRGRCRAVRPRSARSLPSRRCSADFGAWRDRRSMHSRHSRRPASTSRA